MGFETQRRYRSDDSDQPENNNELVLSMGGNVVLSMGGNGDWYVMIVETGKKLGPAVRIATSGAHQDHRMVAPAVANAYRALGGERPFVLVGDDHDLFEPEEEPKVILETNYHRIGHDERPPIRALSNGTVEMIVPSSWGGANTWQRLSAEPAVIGVWRQVVEHFMATREDQVDVHIDPSLAPPANPEVHALRARVAELEDQLETAQANEERWRRDAIEDRPAREVLKEVRGVLGLVEGEGLAEVVRGLVEVVAEFKDVHANLRVWMARAETLMRK